MEERRGGVEEKRIGEIKEISKGGWIRVKDRERGGEGESRRDEERGKELEVGSGEEMTDRRR